MKLRCKNCDSEYKADASRLGTAGSVPCPDCGYVNYLRIQGGDAAGGIAKIDCASCGLAMAARPDHAVPMCYVCSGKKDPRVIDDDTIVQWMIRKGGQKIYGPYDGRTIRQWITANKIEASDEIAVTGARWKPFFETPPFTSAFSGRSKSEAKKKVQAKRKAWAAQQQKKERKKRFTNLGPILKKVAAVGLAAGSLGLAYHTSQNPMFIIPEPIVDEGQALVHNLVEKVNDDKVAPPANLVRDEAEALIAKMEKKWGRAEGSSSQYLLKGRSLFSTNGSLEAAQEALEKAVVLNPRNPHALAGLAEVYTEFVRRGDGSYSQQALRMVDRAFQLSRDNAEILRARGYFLAITGGEKEGRELLGQSIAKKPDDPFTHYLLGLAWLSGKGVNHDEAIKALETSIKLNGRLKEAVGLLGETHLKAGHYRQASDTLRQKLRLAPKDIQANYMLGQLYEDVGEGAQALTHYNKALQSSGRNHIHSLIRAGVLHLQLRGEPRLARDRLKAVVNHGEFDALLPQDKKWVQTQLSTAHRQMGEPVLAVQRAEAALAEDPNYAPALFAMGMAQLAQRQYEAADVSLKRASSLETGAEGRTLIRFCLGMLARIQGKSREALGHFEDAINADGNNIPAHLYLAATYFDAGQNEQANKTMDALALLDPGIPGRKQYRAVDYYQRTFGLQGALQGFARQAKKQYYVPRVVANHGIALFHAGQQAKAIQVLQRALKADPNHAGAAFYLGLVNLSYGRLQDAVHFFTKATQSNPMSGVYFGYLGDAQIRSSRFKEAEESFVRAQRYALNAPNILLGLGILRLHENRKDEAKTTFLKVLKVDEDFVSARWHLFQYDL